MVYIISLYLKHIIHITPANIIFNIIRKYILGIKKNIILISPTKLLSIILLIPTPLFNVIFTTKSNIISNIKFNIITMSI